MTETNEDWLHLAARIAGQAWTAHVRELAKRTRNRTEPAPLPLNPETREESGEDYNPRGVFEVLKPRRDEVVKYGACRREIRLD